MKEPGDTGDVVGWIESMKLPVGQRRRRCLHCSPDQHFDGLNSATAKHCAKCGRVLFAATRGKS